MIDHSFKTNSVNQSRPATRLKGRLLLTPMWCFIYEYHDVYSQLNALWSEPRRKRRVKIHLCGKEKDFIFSPETLSKVVGRHLLPSVAKLPRSESTYSLYSLLPGPLQWLPQKVNTMRVENSHDATKNDTVNVERVWLLSVNEFLPLCALMSAMFLSIICW